MKQLTPEQKTLIQKPLPPAAIKPHPTMSWLSTIKAIYVTERLNEVFGIGGWRVKAKIISSTARKTAKEKDEFTSLVKVIFEVPEYEIYYECIAGSTNSDSGDAAKGGITDALTKICSWIGIGAEVYKGLYNPLEAAKSYIASITDKTALEVFWQDNYLSFVKEDERKIFNNFVAKRKEEL